LDKKQNFIKSSMIEILNYSVTVIVTMKTILPIIFVMTFSLFITPSILDSFAEENNFQCSEGMVLVYRINSDKYACLKPSTADKWYSQGMAEPVEQIESFEKNLYNEAMNPRQTEYPNHLGFNDLHIEAINHLIPADDHSVLDMIVHHHCKVYDDMTAACLLFPTGMSDQDKPYGIEYVIGAESYAELSEEEKVYWHYHKTELPNVKATLPDLRAEEAEPLMPILNETYGKVIYFWQIGDKYPTGEPFVVVIEELYKDTVSTTEEEPITALLNYRALDDSKVDGMAIIDLNPESETFGDILQDVPVGEGVLMHHPFYNSDRSKLYNTALMGEGLYQVNIHDDTIFDVTPIDAGSCIVAEDMIFSKDGEKFYLTCMGSDNILVFDAQTDQIIDEISASQEENPDAFTKYPHGISADEKIDRMIITQTVSPSLDDPQSSVTVVEFSTGKVLSTIELTKSEDTPSAPVEVLFHPEESIAYVTGMLDGTIWVLVWNEDSQSFEPKLVDDGTEREQSWPLDLNIGPNGNLYVSFAVPGVVNEYSLENPEQPKLLRTMPAQPGAHHVLFSEDTKYMFVQNNLLNLDGLNSGTISVIDFASGNLIATIDDLTDKGMMIESLDLIFQDSLTRTTLES
jgi:DNA-binding beta-propeller fold protein YncE